MGCRGKEGNMGGEMPWKHCKGKADLKEGGLLPLWKNNLWNFCFHPGWSSLKFKWISGGLQTSVLALGSVAFSSVLKDCWNAATKSFLTLMWCTGSPKGCLRGESSAWLCHCYRLVSAELEKEERITHSFLVWLLLFPCFHQRAMSWGYQGPECTDRLWTGTGLYSFHTGRKCVCVFVRISVNRQHNLAQGSLIVTMAKHLHHCLFWVTMTRYFFFQIKKKALPLLWQCCISLMK